MSSSSAKKKQINGSSLSEEQKKVCFFGISYIFEIGNTNYQAHHIASEQKRRENIRSEFDKIVSLTPALTESENRSELNILTKSADYIDYLKSENQKLIKLCHERGIAVPDELHYKGPEDITDLDQLTEELKNAR